MSLALPAALWGLLALPAIVLLRLAARRPRVVVVSSLIPWHKAAAASPASHRRNLLLDARLLLQLAAAAAIVLGAAGLGFGGGGPGVRAALAVDNSASMAAGRRMEEARARLRAELLAMDNPIGSLYVSAPEPRRLAGPDAPRAELLQALDGVRPVAAPGDLAGAAGAAARELGGQGTLLAASDDLRPLEGVSAPGLALLRVGGPERNLGIVSAAVESGRGFCAVLNSGSAAERVDVTFQAGDRAGLQQAEIPAGARRGFTFDLPAGTKGFVRFNVASGAGPDALAADDNAWLAAAPEPVPALALDPGRSAARTVRALAALGFPEPRPAVPGETARFVVAVGLWPARVPDDGFALVIDPGEGVLAGVQVTGQAGPGRARAEGELFPHAGGFEFSVPAARTVDPGSGGVAVLASEPGGQALAALSADRRVCVLAFDPESTGWVGHPSFPVFFARLAAACPPLAAMQRGAYLTGAPCPAGLAGPLQAPGGRTVLPGEPLTEAGLYSGAGGPVLAANLLSPEESACAVAGGELRRSASAGSSVSASATRSIAPWLFAAALLLLAAEWAAVKRG